ncbi:MAG: sialate O-acetylesterase [Bacilli bacterium]
MSWVVKKFILIFITIFSLISFLTQANAKNISILIIGQSISSNCNEYKYAAINNIYQINLQGNRIPAKDPFVWADCRGGSMWMPLGDMMIKNKMADEVTFMPIGVGGTSVNDYQPSGRAYPKLLQAISIIKTKKIKFDYIFWHQGSSDIGMNPIIYKQRFLSLVSQINKLGDLRSSKWIIARHSKCYDKIDKNIWKVQTELGGEDNYFRFFLGPDTNVLDNSYRFDTCHLNQKGQVKMAEMWFKSLKNSQKNEILFRKESLLSIFSR